MGSEFHPDDGENLRHQRRSRDGLQHSRRDQNSGRRRQPAQRRGQCESGDAEQKDPLSSEDVPKPSAGDQKHAKTDAIGSHDELQLRRACAQIDLHRRESDVHDEEVEEGEERPNQDDGKRLPSPAIKAGGLF